MLPKAPLILAAMLVLTGCQNAGRKLFGVEQVQTPVPGDFAPEVVVGEISSDLTRVLLLSTGMNAPAYLTVKLVHTSGTVVPLPYVSPTGQQATYTQDRSMVNIVGAQTVLPNCPKYRVEYVKEGN